MEYLTLAGAVDGLRGSGFVEHFGVSGGALRSFDSGTRFGAAELVIREYHRFEGVSDPDDMSIVYGIESQSGVRGTLVDAYGVYSDASVSAFLQGVPIRGASRFSGGAVGRRVFERSDGREPPVFGSYSYGFPRPDPKESWHDEGGESGQSA
jgi:hypothetical protein